MLIADGLDTLVKSVPGLASIIITDKDGVEVLSAPHEAMQGPESARNAQLLSTIFNLTQEQCHKLEEFGTTDSFTAVFESTVICQSSYPPFTITIRAEKSKVSDAGILEVAQGVKTLLSELRGRVGSITM